VNVVSKNKHPFYMHLISVTTFSQGLTQPFKKTTSLWWDTKRNLNT